MHLLAHSGEHCSTQEPPQFPHPRFAFSAQPSWDSGSWSCFSLCCSPRKSESVLGPNSSNCEDFKACIFEIGALPSLVYHLQWGRMVNTAGGEPVPPSALPLTNGATQAKKPSLRPYLRDNSTSLSGFVPTNNNLCKTISPVYSLQ